MKNQSVNCIFSISTGRSGSHYVSRLFSVHPNCVSFHEPKPIGNARAMRQYLRGKSSACEETAKAKSKKIYAVVNKGKVYVETNHCFIKGFGWFVSEYIRDLSIGVIILNRDKEKIARSLLRIGCSPLRPLGRDWTLTPDKKKYFSHPPFRIAPRSVYHAFRFLDLALRRIPRKFSLPHLGQKFIERYELECLRWGVEETRCLSLRYQERFSSFRFFEANIDDLNEPKHVQSMLEYFGLPWSDSLGSAIGKSSNLKR